MMNRDLGTLCLFFLSETLDFGNCAACWQGHKCSIWWKKMNLWGYERSSLSKRVLFPPCDVLCSCSVPESVSQGRWIHSGLVARAVLGGQLGHGPCVSWVRVEMIHSAAANQVSWASVLPWETVLTLQNDSGTNKRKDPFLLFFFFPTEKYTS